MKCNIDAEFNNKKITINRGCCFRDGSGMFFNAGISWDFGLFFIIEAEALALKEAMQESIYMQLNQITFESDSLMVVQAIHTNYGGNSELV